jgi:hypothetical protein
VEIIAVGPTERNICLSASAGKRASSDGDCRQSDVATGTIPPSPTVLEHPIHLRAQQQGARGKWNAVYAVCQESASPCQLEAWDHLPTLLYIQANFSRGTNALEQSSPSRTDSRDETNCLEQRRLVSRAVDVSLAVSPWLSRLRLPPYLPLLCDFEPLASQIRDNIHIYANISWRVEPSGEAVRKLNRCSMHDGGAVYHTST